MKTAGNEYKKDAGVVTRMKHDLPQIGKISAIYIVNSNTVVFRVRPFSSYSLSHFRGYVLETLPLEHEQLVYLSNLVVHNPVHIRTPRSLEGSKFIILPHYIHCD